MQKYFRIFPTLIILLILCSLIGLNEPLWDQDEAAYYGFATEMLQTHDWIVPNYPLSEPHRKTPLHFWTSASMMKMIGTSHFAFRFVNTIYFLLCGLIVYALAFQLSNKNKKEIAKSACIIFYSSIFLMIYQKIALTDIGLLFYSLFGVLCFWNVILLKNDPGNQTRKSILHSPWLWVIGYWIAISLGVLQKGPPILILLGGIFALFLLFSPNRKFLISFHPWIFFPLAILPLLIWGRLAWLATDGALIRWMFDWYILKRTTGSVFGQSGPPGYYLILFLFFLFPWSLSLLKVYDTLKIEFIHFINGIRKDKTIFLLAWIFSGWVFYEFLPSKLPSYSLSVYPLLCILIAQSWFSTKTNTQDRISYFHLITNYLILFVGLVWLSLFIYLVLPGVGSFATGSWIQIAGLLFICFAMVSVLIQVYKIQIFEFGENSRNCNKTIMQTDSEYESERKDLKKANFSNLAIANTSFHCFFVLFYYYSLSAPRNYGNNLADILFELHPITTQTDESNRSEISETNQTIENKKNIYIHPEIRLPSIITALSERGISTKQIHVANSPQEIIQKINSRNGIYLAPQSFLDVLQFIGHRPASKCLEFYSYESGKDLNLCWFLNQ